MLRRRIHCRQFSLLQSFGGIMLSPTTGHCVGNIAGSLIASALARR
jgi:hypothetical protein